MSLAKLVRDHRDDLLASAETQLATARQIF